MEIHSNSDGDLRTIFEALGRKQELTRRQSRSIVDQVMSGSLPDATIAALLGAWLVKGETVEELVGAAQALRAGAVRIRCDRRAIDTCGTGGDGKSTFNVSTTAAIIAAAAGAVVAKHGNRSTSRISGSTEVLVELGIDVDAPPRLVEQSLSEVGVGYLNARLLHPAMRFAAAARGAIPVRTVFNLLGPLCNPAAVRRQLLGVPSSALAEKMAEALRRLGVDLAWVVHGLDGLCDLTITGGTEVIEVRGERIERFVVMPESVGLQPARLGALLIDSPKSSARVITETLEGRRGPCRNHALLNAGAALLVAGISDQLEDGVCRAAAAVDSGSAATMLERWREIAGLAAVSRSAGVERS